MFSPRFVALCTALAVGTGLVFAASPAKASTASTASTIESGSFAWPISKPFLKQAVIRGKGQATAEEGASWDSENLEFTFPITAATHTDGTWTFDLDGSAHVQGYKNVGGVEGWAVDVKYWDLKLKVDGKNATLFGDYKLSGVANHTYNPVSEEGNDEPLVTFTLENEIKAPAAVKELDRETTSDTGLAKSLAHYPKGTVLKESGVDLNVLFKEQATPKSSQGHLSPGAIAGIVIGVLAVLGGAAFATQPTVRAAVQDMLAKFL